MDNFQKLVALGLLFIKTQKLCKRLPRELVVVELFVAELFANRLKSFDIQLITKVKYKIISIKKFSKLNYNDVKTSNVMRHPTSSDR